MVAAGQRSGNSPVEEKSMVPTILVGIGGTGAEILSRVRRLVEETYGGLQNFPYPSKASSSSKKKNSVGVTRISKRS